MSTHISAKPGEIAETILLPGDPLRAKFVAETFLENSVCYNEVRNMFGYTGTYKGQRVSVQGTGMGIPSLSIYAHELISDYGVKTMIRIGSCGAFHKTIKLQDIILAMGACTDSAINTQTFQGASFAPICDFELLTKAFELSEKYDLKTHVGNILATDQFYNEDFDSYKIWAKHGVLAAEMESSALYTIAARHGVKALSILTVSDNLVTHEALEAIERESSFNQMVQLALQLAP